MTHTHTLVSISLDEGSDRRTHLYLTTHTYNRRTAMQAVRIEPVIPATKRPQTHALNHATTGIGSFFSNGNQVRLQD